METDFLTRGQALAPELIELWHAFHRCPELGNREFETSRRIRELLSGWGLECTSCLDTGIVALLRGGRPGRTVALRADMDALPVTEATGAAFASQTPGRMHACGHDFHITAALGAARLLSERREELPGNVKFLFQPDEEGSGGAERMIREGCLRSPTVDAVFGAHVSPELPAGTVGVRYGKFYAASDTFTVTVHGESCHGATPEKGIDALRSAAEMVCALGTLREELTEQYGPTVISVGMLEAGTAENIIAGTAVFSGIIRTLGPEARSAAVAALGERIEALAAAAGTRVDLLRRESYPGIVNRDAETRLAEESAGRLLGDERVVRLWTPTMTTEDFGVFLQHVPGSFYHIGVGGDYPLHSAKFLPDAAALPIAAAVHAAVLWDYLHTASQDHRGESNGK